MEDKIQADGCTCLGVESGKITGIVFNDFNNIKVIDFGEEKLSWITVSLLNSANQVVKTAITNISGEYIFTLLAAGTYKVQFPTNTADGKTITTTNPIPIVLTVGQILVNINAGFYKVAASTCADGTPLKTVGSTCNDNNANTTDDKIQADGCTCAGNPIANDPCAVVKVIGTDGKITISGLTGQRAYVQVFTNTWGATSINSGDKTATNGVITLPIGSGNYIVKVGVFQGGKWCDVQINVTVTAGIGTQNCTDGTAKKVIGSVCNDNNTNTTDDKIQADGCTCTGTAVVASCLSIKALAEDGKITISGLSVANVYIQVFTNKWGSTSITGGNKSVVNGQIVLPLPAGSYIIKVGAYQGTWCDVRFDLTIGSGAQNCADGTAKKVVGSACNDNNANTTNDVIQADGCSCAGTPNVVTSGCNTIELTSSSTGNINITGLGTYTSTIQVFTDKWSPVSVSTHRTSIVNIPAKNGSYIVKVDLYNVGIGGSWKYVCNKQFNNISITGSRGDAFEEGSEPKIYPNPVESYLMIDFNGIKTDFSNIKLYDPLGRVLIEQNFDAASVKNIFFDTQNLNNGFYILAIEDKVTKYTFTKKIVIQK